MTGLVASRERTGTEGQHRWTWTASSLLAELRLDGDLLFSVHGNLSGEPWAIHVHGKAEVLVRIEVHAACGRRIDDLLVEALRNAVMVARSDGWELPPEAWGRIAAARPKYNPRSNALEVAP